MTVEEALADLLKSREMGWTPGVEAVSALRRYVDRVNEAKDLCVPGSAVQHRLAAAQEGRDEHSQGA